MTGFTASYLEIKPHELLRHVLRGAGQCERQCVNPRELLDFLKLESLTFNFAQELPEEAKQSVTGDAPRALLSLAHHLVATDDFLDDQQTCFGVLHEIAHYLLPHHDHSLYVCDELGLSFATRLILEKEANEFAMDLLFLGDRFAVEANCQPMNAKTVKNLARQYRASWEATARRLVEKNFRPCMSCVFEKEQWETLDENAIQEWKVRNCHASPTFKTTYFEKLSGRVPLEAVAALTQTGRERVDNFVCDIGITSWGARRQMIYRAEFFCNPSQIFCLLSPAKGLVPSA